MHFHTLFNLRLFQHLSNFLFLIKCNKHFPEGNGTIAYKVEVRGKKIFILGSFNSDKKETYPTDIDLLVLPYQGRSNLVDLALEVVERIMPKKILLSHFDNAFPPISKAVDTKPFTEIMCGKYPKIQVIKPNVRESIVL